MANQEINEFFQFQHSLFDELDLLTLFAIEVELDFDEAIEILFGERIHDVSWMINQNRVMQEHKVGEPTLN